MTIEYKSDRPSEFDTCISKPGYWHIEEIDQLRMDVEDMEIEVENMQNRVAFAKQAAELANANARKSDQKRVQNKLEVFEEFKGANKDLSDKCMIYLSLVNEYENMLDIACSGGIRPTNNNIINLRKRGGLTP
jgi:hypothetical protein